MKKIIILLLTIIWLITGCESSKIEELTLDSLTADNGLVFSINAVNPNCVTPQLSLYKDGTYKYYDKYKYPKDAELVDLILRYANPSKVGKYDYDLLKIIQNSDKEISFSVKNLPSYQISTGNGENYAILKKNRYLNELLNELDINLNTCAEKEYYTTSVIKYDQDNDLVIEKLPNCNNKVSEYYEAAGRKVYFVCLSEIYLQNEDHNMPLSYHFNEANQSFEESIKQVERNLKFMYSYDDGGTAIYRDGGTKKISTNNITMIVCNKLSGNRDIYFGDGNLEFIDENDRVLLAGLGRKGHAVGDIPGVRFKVVHVADIGLNALFRKKKEKPKSK